VPARISGSELTDEQSVVIGASLTLQCPATGEPKPDIQWTRHGETLSFVSQPNLRVVDGGRELQLLNTHLFDAGSYTCTATNPAGNASKQFLVNVMGVKLHLLCSAQYFHYMCYCIWTKTGGCSCLQAGRYLKSVGLVQMLAAVLRCSAFIAWTGWNHAMILSHVVSAIKTVLVFIIIIIIIKNFIQICLSPPAVR